MIHSVWSGNGPGSLCGHRPAVLARQRSPGQHNHSKIVASFANTSSTIVSGALSSFVPLRAPRSSARGWSQRTIPVVLVPAPSSVTAKPAARAKFPPLVIGTTTGTFVTRLNASGDTTRTGRRPFCSCPCETHHHSTCRRRFRASRNDFRALSGSSSSICSKRAALIRSEGMASTPASGSEHDSPKRSKE